MRTGAAGAVPVFLAGDEARRATLCGWSVMRFDNLVPWRARPNFRLDASAAFLSGLYAGGIFPFTAFIARDRLQAGGFELGLMTAAPFVGNLIALPLSHLLDRGHPVRGVTLAHTLARLIMVTASFVHGSVAFAWVVFAVQCAGAVPAPLAATVLRLIYPLDWVGRLLSYSRFLLLGGMILSTLAAGVLIERYSYRWVFLAFAPLGLAAMAVYSRIRIPGGAPPPAEDDVIRHTLSALRLLRENPSFRWFSLAVFVYGFGNLMSVPVCTIYQVDVLKISSAQLATLNIVTQVVWMLSYVFWGRIVDRANPLRVVLVNTLMGAVMPLNHIIATEVWMLLPMAIVNGVVYAGIELSYFNSVMHFSTPEDTARYQGVHNLLLGLRGCVAPFVGAGMAQWLLRGGRDVRWVFLIGMLLVLAGAWLQWRGLKAPGGPQTRQ